MLAMVAETEFNSMIWPSTTVSGCKASCPMLVRTRLPSLPDNSTALTELEPMSKPIRFFLAVFLLNMLLPVPRNLLLLAAAAARAAQACAYAAGAHAGGGRVGVGAGLRFVYH